MVDVGLETPHNIHAFRSVLERRSGRDVDRHFHRFHEMIILLHGLGVQLFGSLRLPLNPGDLCFLPARSWHIAGSLRPSSTCIVLNFYDSSFADVLPGDREARRIVDALVRRATAGSPLLAVAAHTRREVRARLTAMATAGEHRHEFGTQCAIKADLLSILALLAADSQLGLAGDIRTSSDPQSERVERVTAFVQEHLTGPLSVARLASAVGLSPSHFHTVFRQQTGLTVIDYVTRVRVQAAADLLRTLSLPIKDVARRCGFPCLSHFYAVFRRHTGLPPAQFVAAHGRPLAADVSRRADRSD